MIVIAIITEYIDATSTNPNRRSYRQTSNPKVSVAGTIPKVLVVAAAAVPLRVPS